MNSVSLTHKSKVFWRVCLEFRLKHYNFISFGTMKKLNQSTKYSIAESINVNRMIGIRLAESIKPQSNFKFAILDWIRLIFVQEIQLK